MPWAFIAGTGSVALAGWVLSKPVEDVSTAVRWTAGAVIVASAAPVLLKVLK